MVKYVKISGGEGMKTGLVLEGGGVRGIYTAGVLDLLFDNQITFDGVAGTSAGAVHGCSFLSGQRGRSIRYYLNYCKDPRFMSIRSWIKTGNVVETEFSYHTLPEVLDPYDFEAFKQNPTPFFAVCTSLESGKAEYIRITDMKEQIDAIRASASLPYFSNIVEIDGKKYLDGGCSEAIPLFGFMKMGFEKNLVVLTRPESYVKKPEFKGLEKLIYRKYPDFVSAMQKRHEVYNQTVKQIAELEKQGKIFVIRPENPLPAGRMEHDPEKIKATYDLGVKDAEKALESLKAWLSQE